MPNTSVPAAGEAMPAAYAFTAAYGGPGIASGLPGSVTPPTAPSAPALMPALAGGTSAVFLIVNAKSRVEIATSIERLINMLDELEPDPDLEPDENLEPTGDENEPGLGAPEIKAWDSQASWAKGANDGREDDGDDREPSIGGMGKYCSATGQMQYDLEASDGDDEPNGDDEVENWTEKCGQGPVVGVDCAAMAIEPDGGDDGGGLMFDGTGNDAARDMLRGKLQGKLPGNVVNLTIIGPGFPRLSSA